jgi:hypothetical protein
MSPWFERGLESRNGAERDYIPFLIVMDRRRQGDSYARLISCAWPLSVEHPAVSVNGTKDPRRRWSWSRVRGSRESRFFLCAAIYAASGGWLLVAGGLRSMLGGALLATPLADRPKGARPPIKDKPAKELQAAPLQVHCFSQIF